MEQYSTERFQTVWCPLLPYSLLGFQACPVLQARPTCRRALHSCRSSDRCLSLYSYFYYSYSTADLQPLLQRLQPLLILQLQDLLRDVQPPTMAQRTWRTTHTGFFFKGFLPLDTREPRISFSPNHISHFFCIVWNISWHIWRGEGEPIQYMTLSLSPHR